MSQAEGRVPVSLGCIADDFTGATDLGSVLAHEGVRVVQLMGVPDDRLPLPDVDAMIVALKTRTTTPQEAVARSLAALAWLRTRGADRIFFKYCSTFDSRPDGNIGPVIDALMDALDCPLTSVCPAFPETGRTVYQGHLFVGDLPLDESGMAEHPLTPMHDSSLRRLLAAQAQRSVGLVAYEEVRRGPPAIRLALEEARRAGHAYVVTDALDDRQLRDIGEAVADLPLTTGASGVARGLPDALRRRGLLGRASSAPQVTLDEGATAILAGSVSESTRAQLERLPRDAAPVVFDPVAVAASEAALEGLFGALIERLPGMPVLHPRNDPDSVRQAQETLGRETSSRLVEDVMARAAVRLAERGVRRFIVAGGETAAAVVEALGIQALLVGPEIAPGVPWCRSVKEPTLSVALKSGNFGGPTFFADALRMLP